MTHSNSNPFEVIYSELNELKGMINQIINTPKEDYSLKLYSIKEAAKLLKCSPQTVSNQIERGNIIASNFGKGIGKGRTIRIKHDQIFNSDNEVKSLKYKRKA